MRFVFCCLLIILCSNQLKSQQSSSAFQLIIKSGTGLHQIDGDNYSGYYKLGYLIEIASQFQIRDNISAEIGLRSIMKGGKSTLFNQGFDDYEVFQLIYAGPRAGITLTDKNRASIGLGIQFNRLITSSITLNGEDNSLEYPEFFDNEFTFSLNGSIKVTEAIWPFFEFERSLNSISKWPNSNLEKQAVINKGISVGLLFKLQGSK